MPSKENTDLEYIIKGKIRSIPDYPRPGISFKDITPLLKDTKAFNLAIDALAKKISAKDFDYIAGIEARGFIIGSALSYKLKKGFIPIRKKGKLPYEKIGIDYELEYGKETLEVHKDAVEKGSRVLIVDDLLATGGTAKATADLLTRLGAKVSGYAFIVELSFLDGRKKLGESNITFLVAY